jgi:hypothetical protein
VDTKLKQRKKIMLTSYQPAQLKDLVRPKEGAYYQGTDNRCLDEFIDSLQAQHPEKFHQDATSLRKRVFYDEPARTSGHGQLPMAGFIRPYK